MANIDGQPSGARWNGVRRLSLAMAVLFVVIGVGFRAAPLLNQGERLMWQWPTEDGYLMMTIARNIALGRGMAVSEGEIPTNGTQPLATIVWSGLFWLTDGDRTTGVLLVQIAQIVIALITACLLYRIGRLVLHDRAWAAMAAGLGASLWFASPVVINHTMNGLETGLYLMLLALSVLLWLPFHAESTDHIRVGRAIGIGACLGLTFLARIDAVFFIAAVTGWHSLLALPGGRPVWLRRTAESFVIGVVSILVASPWLVYNQVRFGSIMPISGTSQSFAATIGANLDVVPTTLFEYVSIVLAIPSGLSGRLPLIILTTAIVMAYAVLLITAARGSNARRRAAILVGLTTGLGLIVYYGLFFGAPHFVSRYLSPWSLLTALATTAMLFGLLDRIPLLRPHMRLAVALAGLGALVVSVGLNARIYMNHGRGSAIEHKQVISWVEENAAPETWVGAVQTGVLGFFHERSVNLDGKVNPYALQAQLDREIPRYVVNSPIKYIADWNGIRVWMGLSPIDEHFELLVDDANRNIAVLRRIDEPPADGDLTGGRSLKPEP